MSWIKNGSIVLISCLMTLLLAEGALRFYYAMLHHLAAAETRGNPHAYKNPNEYYGFIPTVAMVQFYSKAGYRPFENYIEEGISSNEVGLRSKLTKKEINGKRKRIIVSGGSTAWGAGVKDSDLFSNYFGGVSAGVGGYVFSNESAFIRDFISAEIDITHWVSLSGWNDVYAAYRGNSYYKSPDMFGLGDLVHNYTSNDRVIQIKTPTTRAQRSFSDYKIKLMFFIDKAFTKIEHMQKNNIQEFKGAKPNLIETTTPMEYEKFWRLFSQEVLLAAYWSRLNGIEFTFALQPSLYNTKKDLHDAETNMLDLNSRRYLNLANHYQNFYPRLTKDLANLASRYNFNFIDTDAAMLTGNSKVQYFVDHVHLGSIGNEALGMFLHENLSR